MISLKTGSFGPIASARQGSPRGGAANAVRATSVLGGEVRPPALSNKLAGSTLGNISANLPKSGSVVTVRSTSSTPANVSSQIAATRPRTGWSVWNYLAAGLGVVVLVVLIR